MPNCLNNMSWRDIRSLGVSAPAFIRIGDFKDCLLKDGSQVQFRVIGINHDVTEDGRVVPLTWEMVDCMPSRYPWCRGDNVEVAWGNTYIFGAMNYPDGEVYQLIPDEIIEIAVPVVKKTAVVTEDSFDIVDSVSKFFLKSEVETFGRAIYSADGEGNWYAWYRQEGTPWYKNRNGGREYTMLRSPVKGNPGYFCIVAADGYANPDFASYSYGLAPAFCSNLNT